MNKKQKEALVLALLGKGKTYREITREARVSPNTIKAIANKSGLDESTSISSRAFELYVERKTPIEVAIALNLEAEKAINYYHEYFMLLGITEFTKSYLQVKNILWPFVNLANLVQNARMGDSEVVELLKIAKGYLPRVRLEYDRLKEEKNSLEAEINSLEAEKRNSVRIYQGFCDRNLALKNREDELQLSISELEDKQTKLNESLSEFQYNINLDPDVEQDDITLTNDVLIPPRVAINCPPQVEPSSRKLIFDTKDLFPTKAQT